MGGEGRVILSNVDTWRLPGFENRLTFRFKLAADMLADGIRKFMNDIDGPAFLEMELMGLGVDGYR